MKKATMYVDKDEKKAASDYVALVQFDHGNTESHKFTQYSYEDVFAAIVELYKGKEEQRSILRILIETR